MAATAVVVKDADWLSAMRIDCRVTKQLDQTTKLVFDFASDGLHVYVEYDGEVIARHPAIAYDDLYMDAVVEFDAEEVTS